jgi:hypothetical protein
MALAHVQDSALNLTRQLGLSENLAMLDHAWEAEAGGLARFSRIIALDRESLVVEVDSAAAMQEISLRRREFIRRLNRHFPEELIKHITVRISNHG